MSFAKIAAEQRRLMQISSPLCTWAEMAGAPSKGVICMTVGAVRRGFSFRSVHAAMKAARDGDQIILRKGIHNGLG